jgi:hypothetical protein
MKTKNEEIQSILKRGECEVIFRKKDGSEREMLCTLHPDYLPQRDEDPSAGGGKSTATEETVVVWDIEAEAWRSFRIDSIIQGPTHVG